MIPLAALALLAIAALLYLRNRLHQEHRSDVEQTTELFERIIRELNESAVKEREAQRVERQELANRIQRPESTPMYDIPEGEEQALPFEDDDAFWAYKSGVSAE